MTSNRYVRLAVRPVAVMIAKRQMRSREGLMRDYNATRRR